MNSYYMCLFPSARDCRYLEGCRISQLGWILDEPWILLLKYRKFCREILSKITIDITNKIVMKNALKKNGLACIDAGGIVSILVVITSLHVWNSNLVLSATEEMSWNDLINVCIVLSCPKRREPYGLSILSWNDQIKHLLIF